MKLICTGKNSHVHVFDDSYIEIYSYKQLLNTYIASYLAIKHTAN